MTNDERKEFLAKLIKIDTIGGNEDRVANVLKESFSAHNINCELVPVQPGRSNFYASMGNGKGRVLALSGHQDVVKTGDPADWTFPPLSAQVKDGKMYGRGTADMKSGLAAAALAMMELADEGVELNGTIKFLGTVGEETSENNDMQGARKFAQAGYVNDVDALVIAEPSDGDIVYAHKGSITYRVVSIGIAAHSSTPDEGYNAITPLVRFYELQEKLFSKLNAKNPYLGTTIPVVTRFDGGDQLNSVPDKAELYVKMRTIPEINNETILNQVGELIEQVNTEFDAKLSLSILGNKKPVVTNPNDRFVQLVDSESKKLLNKQYSLHGISAGTDASEMTKANNHMSVVIYGPGSLTPHQVDEYVVLDQYYRFIDIYKQLAKDYLK